MIKAGSAELLPFLWEVLGQGAMRLALRCAPPSQGAKRQSMLQINKLGEPIGRHFEKNGLKVLKFSDEERGYVV